VGWAKLAQNKVQCRAIVNKVKNSQVP